MVNKVVMAVDDNQAWLDTLCNMVRRWGYDAVCVTTAKAALEIFPAAKPFAVLTDLRLANHIDGVTLASRLHMQDPMCIFIAISGLISTWDLGFLLGSVFTDALTKPIDAPTLQRILGYALEKRQRWELLI